MRGGEEGLRDGCWNPSLCPALLPLSLGLSAWPQLNCVPI